MTLTRKQKIWLGVGAWLLLTIVIGVLTGSEGKNDEFQPQNEFKLDPWVSIKLGSLDLSINKAVLYLVLASVATVWTLTYIAKRMQQRPNRVQTAVELLFSFMRDNITRGNLSDDMAVKWFPFLGALFLFIEFSNLIGYIPLPTSEEKFNVFGAHIPSFALYAATANISVPLVLALIVFVIFNAEGIRAQGPFGYIKSLIPAGVSGPILVLIFPLEVVSTIMRLLSLTIRLFANILAGHMIILFMTGGLAVVLGLSFLGWFTLPAGLILYLFELGVVATLQAFIFATLAAIYIGGAVSHH
jgi:F-type H+-transporting ATPase subunit a